MGTYFGGGNAYVTINAIAADLNGNAFIVGSELEGGYYSAWLSKFTATGSQSWGYLQGGGTRNILDYGYGVATDGKWKHIFHRVRRNFTPSVTPHYTYAFLIKLNSTGTDNG